MTVSDPLPDGRAGGPCDWPFEMACCADLDLTAIPADTLTVNKTWVAEVLWMATGRRFGLCEKLIRPCNRACVPGPWPQPNLYAGQWFNTCGCDSASDCSCGPLCEIALDGPVASICEVLIDGEVIDPNSYRVDDSRFLVRLAGGECWPRCQHMDTDITEPGSFAVRYYKGTPVPEGGAFAAGQYLCEMLKWCTNDKSCRLPRNTTQVNRAGIQMNFGAGAGKFGPITGIPEVDLWIGLVNPTAATSAARVWSPDLARKARATTSPQPPPSCTPVSP